jgi:hypothetical protein
MKSIKQQYIDLQEGNMSQANFMRNLRMTLPQYVTNLSSFEDSIRILKNKGILTEADMKIDTAEEEVNNEEETNIDDLLSDMSVDGVEISNRANPRDGFSLGFFEEGLDENVSDDDIMKKYNEMFDKNPQTKFADVAKALNIPEDQVASALQAGAMPKFGLREAKDEKGKWTNTSGKSMYDQFKEIDNLNAQEVLIGLDWEMEKNPELSKAAAAKIVVKNLKKNPLYYTMTDLAGKEGAEAQYMGPKADVEARQMQYLEKNMGNVVDKKRGMQPVKDIEKPKKDSDKGGETNKMEKGISLMSLIAKSTRGVQKMDATGEKMKKIAMNEGMEGQYTFNGYFKGGELDKLMTMIPDAEIDDQTEYGQGTKTTIFSQQYSDEEIRKAVNSVIGMPGTKKDVPGTIFNKNAGITAGLKSLTKDDLMEMIRKEIAGAYGGDQMSAEDGDSYTND